MYMTIMYFKTSLIIHKPNALTYRMVDKTSRAVVLKPNKTSLLVHDYVVFNVFLVC